MWEVEKGRDMQGVGISKEDSSKMISAAIIVRWTNSNDTLTMSTIRPISMTPIIILFSFITLLFQNLLA